MSEVDYEYDIALSFAGEDRAQAEEIAEPPRGTGFVTPSQTF
jgi:hypothetical protein